MARSNAFIPLLLAATLLMGVLPVQAASDPATDATEQAVKGAVSGNAGPRGNSTFQKDWQTFNEVHTLFPLIGGTLRYGGLNSGNDATGSANLYDPVGSNAPAPVPGTVAVASQDAVYAFGPAGADTEVYALSVNVFLAAKTTFPADVQIRADGVTLGSARITAGGSATAPGTAVANLAPQQTTQVTGIANFDPPLTIRAGQQIAVAFHAAPGTANMGDDMILRFGHTGSATVVRITTDTARVSLWTENLQKEAMNTYPAPSSAPTADRTMQIRVAHLNGFGNEAIYSSHTNAQRHTLRVLGPDGNVYYDNKPFSMGNLNLPSTVNVPADQRWGAFRDDLARDGKSEATSNGLNMVTYRMTYPATLLPQGIYKVEVGAAGQAWKAIHEVTVGGTGSTLRLSTLEQSATKEIFLGETTTFRLTATNTGGARDTLALTATPALVPSGWSAVLNPATLTLDPGQSGDALLTVTPSALGRAGDTNTIVAKSTSLLSGFSSPALNLTVRLTDLTAHGVRILTESASVKLGPGSTRSIPVAIENSGNVGDRFMVTLEGAPIGWTATLSPSQFDLAAKSQNSAILTLRAPADAVRGSFFSLTLRAVGVDDASVQASKLLSVQVFQEDAFRFVVFDGLNPDGSIKTIATSGVASPVIHSLRDEGPDADVRSNTCLAGAPACAGPATITGSTGWDSNVEPDRDYDQSTLFRLMLVNDGDREDLIRLVPKLVTDSDARSTGLASAALQTTLGYQDLDGCEEAFNVNDSGGDGRNDGWRFRLFDPDGSTSSIAGRGRATKQNYNAVAAFEQNIAVAAHSTKYVYVEMAVWDGDTDAQNSGETCDAAANAVQGDSAAGARASDPAPGHAVAIEAISQNDPTQRGQHVLNAVLRGAGAPGASPVRIASQTYSDQVNAVAFQLENAELGAKTAQVDGLASARTASYRLRAVNMGNEMDTLRFTVPQTENGWTRSLDSFGTALMFPNAATGHAAGGRNATCTAPTLLSTGNLLVECTLGAHDEVAFTLSSTVPDGTAIGTLDRALVTVTSKDSVGGSSATIAQNLLLTTRATGSYAFNLLPDVTQTTLSVYPGGSASVPFTIRNIGTQADRFQADLVIAPSAGWTGTFALANPIAIPAGRSVDSVLSVHAPAGAAVGAQERLRMRVTSLETPTTGAAPADFLDIVVNVVASPQAFSLVGNPPNVVTLPGQAVDVTFRATRSVGNAASVVNFTFDDASLPPGWTRLSNGSASIAYSGGLADATFRVLPPADALGTSRAAIRVIGTDGSGASRFAEVGVALSAPFIGIRLTAQEPNGTLLASGATAQTLLTLTNLGVNNDTVTMSAPAVPAGWAVTFDPAAVPLQPLESVTVKAIVSAPTGLPAGSARILQVRGTSADGLHVSVLDLNFTTGTSLLGGSSKVNGTLHAAPLETTRWVVTVRNNGTLADDVRLTTELPAAYRGLVQVTVSPATLALGAGEAADVQVEAVFPTTVAPGSEINVSVVARSIGPYLNETGTIGALVRLLDYRVLDADGDLVDEMAVDRNRDARDGLEQYLDPSATGLASAPSQLEAFLNDATRTRLEVVATDAGGNVTRTLGYRATGHCLATSDYDSSAAVDGDCDGRTDHLVDSNGDNVPDHYVDADRLSTQAITLRKDVNQDLSPELFLDVDDDQRLDQAFDLANAKAIPLLQRDIDGDGKLDYVVDIDGDGQADGNEPVVYTKTGTFVVVERIDINGDGKLDEVYDTDGDGSPDSFIPNGATEAIPIVLRDVNGDGIVDWTFDPDGDGKRDRYYDPATGQSTAIDTGSVLLDSIKAHWYIGALFGMVLVLFVVLLAVTRK